MSTPSRAPQRSLPRTAVRLLVMGPPGAGKGTQAERISVRYGIPAISTGDIFRSNVAAGTPLGLRAQQVMASGGYVDDELTNSIVADRLTQDDAGDGFLLDGYPRTVPQVDALDQLLAGQSAELTAVIHLVAGAQEVTARLLGRAEHQGRADDTADAIRERQRVHERATAPVLDLYRRRGCLTEIDALGPPEDVTERILTALEATRSVPL